MNTVLLALLFACNGPDQGFSELVPEISVAPEEVVFDDTPVFSQATGVVFISNAGRAFTPFSLEIQGGDGAFTIEIADGELAGGDVAEIPVFFDPVSEVSYAGTLVVTSEDRESPVIEVPLRARGIPAPVPDISITPAALDFGNVDGGSHMQRVVEVRNEGDANLEILGLTFDGSPYFTLPYDPTGSLVAPGSVLPVLVNYDPINTDGDRQTLTVSTNDPDEAAVDVLLLGNGGADFEYPVAIIDCPGAARPPETVFIDGSASTDPLNGDLDYSWRMFRQPDGSQADLSTYVGDQTSYFADLAGEYEIELVVTNSLGVPSVPARCIIDAVPEDEIHIELTWDTARADLDLHLRQDGAEFFQNPGDANFCNPNPNWGASSDADDPRLDIDDKGGFGPENINVQFPENGDYYVDVHYFDDKNDGDVEATVRIYVYGALLEETKKVLKRNQVWEVAQITMPDGTAGLLNRALRDADARTCY